MKRLLLILAVVGMTLAWQSNTAKAARFGGGCRGVSTCCDPCDTCCDPCNTCCDPCDTCCSTGSGYSRSYTAFRGGWGYRRGLRSSTIRQRGFYATSRPYITSYQTCCN